MIYVDCYNLSKVVRPTDELYFDDGKIRGEIIDVDSCEVKVRMRDSHALKSRVQIKLQSSKYEMIPLL